MSKKSHKFHETNKNDRLLDYYGSIFLFSRPMQYFAVFYTFFIQSSNFNSII